MFVRFKAFTSLVHSFAAQRSRQLLIFSSIANRCSNQTSPFTIIIILRFSPQAFAAYGNIQSIRLTDKGFGFVEFSSHESAARAIISCNKYESNTLTLIQ